MMWRWQVVVAVGWILASAALAEEESLRIKNRIASGLAERDWEVPEELRDTCAKALPPGYRLEGGRIRA